MSIEPRNLTAQLHHRAAGNPPSTLPDSAISNCFPGLEFDFRNIWRRVFEGIEIHEASGFVVRAEGALSRARGPLPARRGGRAEPASASRGPTGDRGGRRTPGIAWLEWSNFLADVLADSVGELVPAEFFDIAPPQTSETVELRVRPLFVRSPVTGRGDAADRRGARRAGRADPEPVLALAERLPRVRLLLLGRQPARLRQRRADRAGRQHRQQLDGPQPRAQGATSPTTRTTRGSSATRTSSATGRDCCGSSSRAATMTELFELSRPAYAACASGRQRGRPAPVRAERQPALRRRRRRPGTGWSELQRAGDDGALADAADPSSGWTRRPTSTTRRSPIRRFGRCRWPSRRSATSAAPTATPTAAASAARPRTCRRTTALASVDLLLSRVGRGRAGQPGLPRRRAAAQPRRAPRRHRAGVRSGRRARDRRHLLDHHQRHPADRRRRRLLRGVRLRGDGQPGRDRAGARPAAALPRRPGQLRSRHRPGRAAARPAAADAGLGPGHRHPEQPRAARDAGAASSASGSTASASPRCCAHRPAATSWAGPSWPPCWRRWWPAGRSSSAGWSPVSAIRSPTRSPPCASCTAAPTGPIPAGPAPAISGSPRTAPWPPATGSSAIPQAAFGSVTEGIDRRRQLRWLDERHVHRQQPCSSCWARYLCGGGCHHEVIARGRPACDYIRGWLHWSIGAYARLSAARPDYFSGP